MLIVSDWCYRPEIMAARAAQASDDLDTSRGTASLSESFESTDTTFGLVEESEFTELLCARVKHVFVYQRAYSKFYFQVRGHAVGRVSLFEWPQDLASLVDA